MPTAVHGLQLEASFISSPENKTCQDCTGKHSWLSREKWGGVRCALGEEMKASAGVWKMQRKKVS